MPKCFQHLKSNICSGSCRYSIGIKPQHQNSNIQQALPSKSLDQPWWNQNNMKSTFFYCHNITVKLYRAYGIQNTFCKWCLDMCLLYRAMVCDLFSNFLRKKPGSYSSLSKDRRFQWYGCPLKALLLIQTLFVSKGQTICLF